MILRKTLNDVRLLQSLITFHMLTKPWPQHRRNSGATEWRPFAVIGRVGVDNAGCSSYTRAK